MSQNIVLFEEEDDEPSLFENTITIQPTDERETKQSRRRDKKLRKKIKKISHETKLERLRESGILKNENVPKDIVNVIFDNMV